MGTWDFSPQKVEFWAPTYPIGGGFNPSQKYARQVGSFPLLRVEIKMLQTTSIQSVEHPPIAPPMCQRTWGVKCCEAPGLIISSKNPHRRCYLSHLGYICLMVKTCALIFSAPVAKIAAKNQGISGGICGVGFLRWELQGAFFLPEKKSWNFRVGYQ